MVYIQLKKIIRKVGNKYLVKWKGYDDSFNSYVNKNDIVKYINLMFYVIMKFKNLHFMS